MTGEVSADTKWLAVIGRALAYLCMKHTAGEGKSLQQNAKFLEDLGLNRADAAAILGTTPASITELHRQARNKKGAKRGTKKKTSPKR